MIPRAQARFWALFLLSLLGLTAVGVWTHGVVRRNVRERTEDRLRLVMNSMYEGLNAWLVGEHELVRWIAAEPGIRADLLEISARAPRLGAAELRRLPARVRLMQRLEPVLESHGYENFAFVAPDGRILTSNDSALVGRMTRAYPDRLVARMRRGETVTTPYGIGVVDTTGLALSHNRPVILTASPVFSDPSGAGELVGWLDLRADPATDLNPIITAGRPGQTGETYFFSEGGIMLSTSRFDGALQEGGAPAT